MNPHVLTVDQVAQELKTDTATGLSDAEASARLQQYGANELIEAGRKGILAMVFDQVKELMVVILLVVVMVAEVGKWLRKRE